MCRYDVESIMPEDLSYEDIKNIICRKLARIIISKEDEVCTF